MECNIDPENDAWRAGNTVATVHHNNFVAMYTQFSKVAPVFAVLS